MLETLVRIASRCDGVRCDRALLSLPEDQRLSAEQLIDDLKAARVDARYVPKVDEIVQVITRESRAGDLVVIMSNGGFDDIHGKLLTSLEDRAKR